MAGGDKLNKDSLSGNTGEEAMAVLTTARKMWWDVGENVVVPDEVDADGAAAQRYLWSPSSPAQRLLNLLLNQAARPASGSRRPLRTKKQKLRIFSGIFPERQGAKDGSYEASASERRREKLECVKGFSLKAKAQIWPSLSFCAIILNPNL